MDSLPADTVSNATPAKRDRKPPSMAVDMNDQGLVTIEVSGDLSRLDAASKNGAVVNGVLEQISILGAPGSRTSSDAANFVLGFVDSMQPRDAAEMLLLTQMVAVHQATMTLARRLNHVTTLPQQDAAERALNKLARTYAAQMETLKRYRSKGQQVVRVERVTVESGAQAVVGDVHHGGGGNA